MGRFDRVDMSVFGHRDGLKWTNGMLSELASVGSLQKEDYAALAIVSVHPERLFTTETKIGGESVPLSDVFMEAMSMATSRSVAQYRSLRRFARRFGDGANRWIERKHPAFDYSVRDVESGGTSHLGMFEKMTVDDLKGEVQAMGVEDASVFGVDSSLAFYLSDYMADGAQSEEPHALRQVFVSALFHPKFAVVGWNAFEGMRVMEGEGDQPIISALMDIFGKDLPPLGLLSLKPVFGPYVNKKGIVSPVNVIAPRDLGGYLAFEVLEPFAKGAVAVQGDRVIFNFDSEPRPKHTPLTYAYSHGASRHGVDEGVGIVCRVEAHVDPRMSRGDMLGIIESANRGLEDGTKLYIDGQDGLMRLEGNSNPDAVIGYEHGVVDLIATGAAAQAALMSVSAILYGTPVI